MFMQLETSLMTFLFSIFQTNTVKTTAERDPLLALFDVRCNFEPRNCVIPPLCV